MAMLLEVVPGVALVVTTASPVLVGEIEATPPDEKSSPARVGLAYADHQA
jgi:hypothetical protein